MLGIRYPSYYDASIDDETLDPELASPKNDGLMSKEDKAKLDKINVSGDGEIEIEQVVKAADVICDPERNFISETEREAWNNKADNTLASDTCDGLICKDDKIKLDTVEPRANYYVHPESHAASMVMQDETHRFVSDEQIASWETKSDPLVVNADTHYDFPSIGSANVIYKAYSERKTYQWNEEKMVYELLNEPEILNITIINGGSANANEY